MARVVEVMQLTPKTETLQMEKRGELVPETMGQFACGVAIRCIGLPALMLCEHDLHIHVVLCKDYLRTWRWCTRPRVSAAADRSSAPAAAYRAVSRSEVCACRFDISTKGRSKTDQQTLSTARNSLWSDRRRLAIGRCTSLLLKLAVSG